LTAGLAGARIPLVKCDTSTGYPAAWPIISMLVRYGREDGRCAFCNAPDRTSVRRNRRHPAHWRQLDPAERATLAGGGQLAESRDWSRPVLIRLTVAHLDHDPGNCAPSNLSALCNRCHIRWDAAQHAATLNAARRRRLELVGQLCLTPGPGRGIVQQ